MSTKVPVLFVRSDSIYKSISTVDAWDIKRDALNCNSLQPGIYHPPCRGWGRLRKFANVRPGELELAVWSVERIRQYGGVLEHPFGSGLWSHCGLPLPGKRDKFGGFTFPIDQYWFGHKAKKATLLYICGCEPGDLPDFNIDLSQAAYVVARHSLSIDARPEISKADREHTPFELAKWLVDLAIVISKKQAVKYEN